MTPEELRAQAEAECRDAPELVEDRYRELLALAGHDRFGNPRKEPG